MPRSDAPILERNPKIELNVVERLSRRGYRFFGTATLRRDDDVFRDATRCVFADEAATYPVNCVVLVAVERMDALVSPGYLHDHASAQPFVPDLGRAPDPVAR